jgi:hypothetical protein
MALTGMIDEVDFGRWEVEVVVVVVVCGCVSLKACCEGLGKIFSCAVVCVCR